MKRLMVCAVTLLSLMSISLVQGQETADREAVRQAVLDYVEGIYNVEPSRIERSVHPKLAKIGFYRGPNEVEFRSASNMTFERLVELSKTWNKEGKLRKDAPKEVTIYEVLDQTASVKLVAEWGIDYMHLAKFEGKWFIVNVLWQSPRKQAAVGGN